MPDNENRISEANRLLISARTALSRQQPAAAQRSLLQALVLQPDSADALYLYGIACLMGGQAGSAIAPLRKVTQQRRGDANAHMYLGCALHDAGQMDEAITQLRRACELAPALSSAWYNLGKAFKQQRQLAEAERVFRRALTLDERHPLARIGVADIAAMQGDIPKAVAEYRQVLRHHPDRAEAWHGLANLKTELLTRADADQMRRALANPNLSADMRVALGFSLFQALDQLKDYAAAFDVLRKANREKRQLLDWHADAEHQRIERIEKAFRQPLPTPIDPALGQEVIFIISMPRSGSTLIEHILASHHDVEGANEIPDLPDVIADESRRRGQPFPDWVADATAEDWLRLGKDYLARTVQWRKQRPRFTDKGLQNWQWAGAIRAMLPGAKLVHCHRDPVETCFSCYRQLFRHGVEYSYNLDEMAAVYRDYTTLTANWQSRYPDCMLDFPYESLLENPEAEIRRLLSFCDLAFDAACLTPHQTRRDVTSTASAAQVRQPIHREALHSAAYSEQLKTLRQQLAY